MVTAPTSRARKRHLNHVAKVSANRRRIRKCNRVMRFADSKKPHHIASPAFRFLAAIFEKDAKPHTMSGRSFGWGQLPPIARRPPARTAQWGRLEKSWPVKY